MIPTFHWLLSVWQSKVTELDPADGAALRVTADTTLVRGPFDCFLQLPEGAMLDLEMRRHICLNAPYAAHLGLECVLVRHRTNRWD